MKLTLDVFLEDDRWQSMLEAMDVSIVEVAEAAFNASEVPSVPVSEALAAVVLSNNTEVQALNLEYRGKDEPTNVLSFAMLEDSGWFVPDGMDAFALGDIVIAYETIVHEAETQNKKVDEHLLHMVIHGILHLLGYDHIDPDDAEVMEALEVKVLGEFSIANPYET